MQVYPTENEPANNSPELIANILSDEQAQYSRGAFSHHLPDWVKAASAFPDYRGA
jgi:hypothetical protein